MSQENCSFCDPVDLTWRLVSEDDVMRSFLANPRIIRGHTLVIPKRHIEPPEFLENNEAIGIFNEINRLQIAMLGRIAAGVDVFQKTRPEIPEGHNGTKMNHLHFHILPSNPGSDLYENSLVWGAKSHDQLATSEAEELLPILRGSTDD